MFPSCMRAFLHEGLPARGCTWILNLTPPGPHPFHLHTRHFDSLSVRMVFLSSRMASKADVMVPMKMLMMMKFQPM